MCNTNKDIKALTGCSTNFPGFLPSVCPTCNTCPTCGRFMGTWTLYPVVTYGDTTAASSDNYTFTLNTGDCGSTEGT